MKNFIFISMMLSGIHVDAALAKTDQALLAAKEIARRVPTFRNFRGEKPHAVWTQKPKLKFEIPKTSVCQEQILPLYPDGYLLSDSGDLHSIEVVPSPINMGQSFESHGITFRTYRRDDRSQTREEMIFSCIMLTRIQKLSKILKEFGVVEVGVMSHSRLTPRTSFHTFGMGLDIGWFKLNDGSEVDLLLHFKRRPGQKTCGINAPKNPKAKWLFDLACRIYDTFIFQTVITPNYNRGHWNHFHFDIRPDDPRFFLK